MPRPASPADPGTDIAKLEQQARAETDHGVSDVIWAPDGEHLLFNFHGQLYQVIPGQTPQRLIDSESAQNNASSSPHGNRVAYLSGGNLWVMTLDGNKPTAKQIYAPGKNEVSVEEFHWSTDGKHLAFIEADASRVPTRGIPNYLGDETTLPRVKRPFPGEPSESRRLGIVSADGGSCAVGRTWRRSSRSLLRNLLVARQQNHPRRQKRSLHQRPATVSRRS